MPLRERYGRWHIRFWVGGRPFCQATDLVATKRNESAANRIEAESRKLVLEGRAHELRLEIVKFNEAADKFLTWAEGEHRDHPNTTARLRTSFASLIRFFASKPVPSIIEGPINDYKAWRRTEHNVEDITIRHDLHALSKFFGYAIGHNWAKRNPVRGVEIPSDANSVRMYILSQAEELSYFQTAISEFTRTVKGVVHKHGPFQDLYDIGRLILLQGPRPDEVRNLLCSDVDLEKGKLWIRKGKSAAARRELQLLPESKEILGRRLSRPASPWVFPSPKRPGQPITKLNGSHEKVLDATGQSFVLYDLRHTFATRAAERGMPLPLLARILGHANMRTIDKYVHPTQPALDAAMLLYCQPPIASEEKKPRGVSDTIQ